jgi:hypothetical protein
MTVTGHLHTSVPLALPLPKGWALQPPEHLPKQLNIFAWQEKKHGFPTYLPKYTASQTTVLCSVTALIKQKSHTFLCSCFAHFIWQMAIQLKLEKNGSGMRAGLSSKLSGTTHRWRRFQTHSNPQENQVIQTKVFLTEPSKLELSYTTMERNSISETLYLQENPKKNKNVKRPRV